MPEAINCSKDEVSIPEPEIAEVVCSTILS